MFFIALLAVAVYSNTFTATFQFDDYLYVVDYSSAYRPESFWPPGGTRYFTYITFALNFFANGMDVRGYHAVNIAIHIANGILVFFFSGLLTRTPRLSEKGLPSFQIAALAALLFIVHPVQTEAVAYISQRFASLATFFYLLGIVFYLKWRLSEARTRAVLYLAGLISVWAAQMTKEISFTLPFTLLMIELALFRGRPGRRLLKLTPILLAMAVIPYMIFGPMGVDGVGGNLIGAQIRDLQNISRHDYLVTQFRVIVTYLRLLVLPVDQTIDYDYPMFSSFFAPEVFASFIFISSLFIGAVYLFIRFLRGGSGYLALISAGGLWFFITISVESSIVPIKDLIFEHRLYLPSVGVALSASAGLFFVWGKAGLGGPWKAVAAAFALMVLPLGTAAYARNNVWQNGMTLYEDAVLKSPAKERVRYNLAWAYHRGGKIDKAIEQYNEDLKLNPQAEKAHLNLGMIYMGRGERDKAVYHFSETVRINPANAAALYNLGTMHHEGKELDKAIEYYVKAIRAQKDNENAMYNLALAFMEKGDFGSAEYLLDSVLKLNPASWDALVNLGKLYSKTGDQERARAAYNRAVALRPDLAASVPRLEKDER
ncbi:MAG: hypothetical protein A2V21_304100 [Deltaproteobacteria bacterium GWC2_55_46]|nr:MAG: hypothetical protein A2V21_304100 [Deltaproteobacteria bacterium GWC2_55_46]